MGAQKNRLVETVLLSTHNMFWLRNKELNFNYILLYRYYSVIYKVYSQLFRRVECLNI